MLYKYIVVDDSSVLNTKHNKMFKTVKQAKQYMSKHNLCCTHLVYDLSKAPCVNVFDSTSKNTVYL